MVFEIIGPLFVRQSLMRTGEVPLAQAIHHTTRTPMRLCVHHRCRSRATIPQPAIDHLTRIPTIVLDPHATHTSRLAKTTSP